MKHFWLGIAIIVGMVGMVPVYVILLNGNPDAQATRDTRVRYPNEEAIATNICKTQKQRVMYWWIADPRKNKATMTVRCTGVVTMTAEVKF